MNLRRGAAHVICFTLGVAPAYPCEVIGPTPSASDLVRLADRIVVARALSYTTTVADPKYGANGEPEPHVRFQVLETLKGQMVGTELILPAFLTDVSDFNTGQPPYSFVRPSGRMGNCFADEYQQGGTFLLLLKATVNADYTARWQPLAPTNEQVRPTDDRWLLWVREQLP